ncbi:radical SAM protein [Methanoregula sp.]|uniref:B12-binding domain-containing radical SAM protein n=1 Tax=Methanoregula sp. TaxID=2052170 RepID=UPI00356583D5
MKTVVVFVALYSYQNFPVRILHPLLEREKPDVKTYSVFLKNCEVNTFDHPTTIEEKIFLEKIRELNPTIVSFTVLSPYFSVAKKLSSLIKQQQPDIIIIWGGIHPTIYPESCVNEADIVCVGEGEGAIVDLVTKIQQNESYCDINNLWVKTDDKIVKNPLRPLIQNLDSLPTPLYGSDAFFFIENNSTSKKDPILSNSVYLIQSSRGCPWRCSFCVNSLMKPLYKDLGMFVRRKSVGNVISEIKEFLEKTNGITKYILFVDEVFSIDKTWLDEFIKQYPTQIGLPFYVEYHPKLLNVELLDTLVAAGLDTIDLGIQSGSDNVRNVIYNRPGTNKEIIPLAKEIVKRNITLKFDLILDGPYDTEADLEETIKLLYELPKPLHINFFSMQFFPNYPLTNRAIQDNIIKPDESHMENLIEKTMKNWRYRSKLFPVSRLNALKNIIWLIGTNNENDKTVKTAVFSKGIFPVLILGYLHVKSVIINSIFGVGRPVIISHSISAFDYIKKGNFSLIVKKFKEHYLGR